jgi:hypothetical protein
MSNPRSGSVGVYVDDEGDGSLPRVQRILAGIPGGAYRAVGSAFARAARAGVNASGKLVTKEYAVSQSTYKANVTNINHIQKGAQGVSVEFGFRGHVIPLIQFDTSVSKDGRIQTRVKRGSTRTALDNAFISQVGGHTGVYERKTAKRYPIKEKYGPSTAQMMYSNEAILDAQHEVIVETYDKRIEHEIHRILAGYGGGGA